MGSSSTSSRFCLPADITDIVIDHIYDDKPTLLSLALVSRQWRWCAQYHLFYSMRLRAVDSDYHAYLERFVQFIQSNTDLAKFIRELTLGRKPQHATHPTLNLSWLINTLRFLPSLRTLILHSCTLDASNMCMSALPPTPAPGPTLQKLVLSCLRADISTFHIYLSSIHVRNTLHLLSIAVIPSSSSTAPHTNADTGTALTRSLTPEWDIISSVQSLTLELAAFVSRSTLSYYDSLLGRARSLTRLDIGPIFETEAQFDHLAGYLKHSGGALRHLRLELCCSTIPPETTNAGAIHLLHVMKPRLCRMYLMLRGL